jgi:alpha-tubulin suppressor-like RCC1 family protein
MPHSFKNTGDIYTFGLNSDGQLGLEDTSTRNVPTLMASCSPTPCTPHPAREIHSPSGALGDPVAIGQQHTLLLSRAPRTIYYDNTNDQSELSSCGVAASFWNPTVNLNFGQLGSPWVSKNFESNYTRPWPVSVPRNTIQKVVAGDQFTMTLLWNGDVYGQGLNSDGRLGLGHTTSPIRTPTFVTGDVSDLSAFGTNKHSLFLSRKGLIYGCGNNANSQLGFPSTTWSSLSSPTLISTSHFSGVAAGLNHSLFLRHDNEVYACGRGNLGQLGKGFINTDTSSLVRVTGSVSKVFASDQFSFFLDTGSTAYSCGHNNYGFLGVGDALDRGFPTQVSGDIDSISLGSDYTLMTATLNAYLSTPYACGRNQYGQLGVGDTTSRYLPTRVTGQGNQLGGGVLIDDGISAGVAHSIFLKYDPATPLAYHAGNFYGTAGTPDLLWPALLTGNIRQAAAGYYSTRFLTTNDTSYGSQTVTGSLFGIGDNSDGQLGLPQAININPTTYVTGTRYLDFSSVGVGQYQSFFLLEDGTFYSCGRNYEGQLGRGESMLTQTPNHLPTLTGILSSDIVDMQEGNKHSLILTSGGDVYSCGIGPNYSQGWGALGLGPQTVAPFPTYVTGDVKAISAGVASSLFLKNDGYAYGCGKTHSIGLPVVNNEVLRRPTRISGDVVAISAGSFNSFFLSSAGSVYSQGSNLYGQCGWPGVSQIVGPQHVPGPAGFDGNITGISAGSHTLFIKNNGDLYSCGKNDAGQLGLGIVNPWRDNPSFVTTDVSQAEVGYYHSVILKTDGKAYTFGTGLQGQLGDGTTVDKWSPTYVTGASNPVAKVTAAGFRTTFLNHSNDAYSCGQYPLGVPGTSSAFHYVPTYISGNITGIGRMRNNSSSFIDSSGELLVCGRDGEGQLGLGYGPTAPFTYHPSRVPGPYSSFLPIVKIVSNQIASLFLTADGDCYSCGYYANGNLGRPNYDVIAPYYGRTYYPQFVTGSVVDIDAGSFRCMGLVGSDGYAYAYGFDYLGMMGIGNATNTDVWSPTRISGNVAAISFGTSHSAFLTPGGDVFVAGDNTYGQLGIGGFTPKLYPTEVTGNVTGVSFHSSHSLFSSKDGSVYSCGRNLEGQLGLGDYTNRNYPTKIIVP